LAGIGDVLLGNSVPADASQTASVWLELAMVQGKRPMHVLIHDAARK